MNRSVIASLFVSLSLLGCASNAKDPQAPKPSLTPVATVTHDAEVDRAGLMQADRDFAAAVAAHGVDGWVSFFAEDGAQIADKKGLVTGHDAIRAFMGPFLAKMKLRWAPARADVSGDLGYTYGHAQIVKIDDAGKEQIVARTQYLTVWKRQADGSWKVVLDVGNEDAE